MANRLATATSPYLLQHADNPVDWWEWGPDAFDEARRRNVPVLLSVGYAACHWCHVMAHESFEDEATAAYLNEHFVSIKVDREERPDVDAVYMQATTAMTGHGGWPMTCVLDHDGNPFFAGTYFPDQPRHGQPAFRQVLEALDGCLADQAATTSQRVAGQLREHLQQPRAAASAPIGPETLDLAVAQLAEEFDAERRRLRRRAEVPAVDGAGVPAPARRPSPTLAMARRDARGDGARRHPRPARRWLRPLQRRRRLGGAALREDALRQRPAAPRVRRLGRRPSATGRPRASPSSCSVSCARRRAASPPPWTPTPRAPRARSTSGPRPS